MIMRLFRTILFPENREVHYIGGAEVLPAPLDIEQENFTISELSTERHEEAKRLLIEHNLRLVVYVAKKYEVTSLMATTAKQAGVAVRFWTVQKTIETIHKASEKQKIFIVAKTPETVLKLIEGGVPITEVNVGNMHFSEGKRQISKKVYVDDKDVADLKAIEEKGADVYIMDVPGEPKERVK